MRLLVLGEQGMLGHVVKLYFQKLGHDVRGTSRSSEADYVFDAEKSHSEVDKIIDDFQPDCVVNCIGILNQVAEENHPLAVAVNSYLPQYLDELCQRKGAKFIHISTDCVFDGKKGEYTESSFRDATSFYGRSKALGEIDNEASLTLRTSIVGPDMNHNGIGLFQWFMNQSSKTGGFDKVIWTGVTTIELAKAIELAIQNNLTGLRHVVNNTTINKYELLQLFKQHFNKDIEIERKSDYVSNKSLVCTTDFDFQVPSYDDMVKNMAKWVDEHENIYSESQRVRR
jgi:dTDP-4-dehydrorhamnose reductase